MTDPRPAARRRLHLGCLGLVLAIVLITPLVAIWQRNSEISRQELAIKHVEKLGGQADRFSVDLSHTKARGNDLQIVQQLVTLKRLDVGHANLASGDGIHLAALSRLEFLSLAGNNLSDKDLAALGDLSGLRTLSLRDVPITDAGLVHLGRLARLQSLDLAGTHIHAAGLSALRSLPGLESLTVSEHCITPDTLTTLRSLGSLQYVFVDVPAGNGRQARDLLASLHGVHVVGIMGSNSATLWTASTPWDVTTAGLAELVSSEVGLEDHEAAGLLRVLSRLRPHGAWPRPTTAPPHGPIVSETPDRELASINNIEDFIEQLQISSNWRDEQLRRYARDNVTAADVPKLLETVRDKRWHDRSYGFLRIVVSLLVQHGLNLEETEQVLRELLSDEPGSLSPPSPLSHWHSTVIPEMTVNALYPSYDFDFSDRGWTMSSSDARVALRLLRPYAEGIDPLEEPLEIRLRGAVNLALGGIANPELATDILSLLVNRVAGPSTAKFGAVRAVGKVANVAPAAAVSVLPELNRILPHPDPMVRTAAVEAIGYAAAGDDRAARTAADMCLLLLSADRDGIAGAGIALGHLVAGNTPQTRRHIVQQLLRMSSGHWSSRSTQVADRALEIVITTIRDRMAANED